MPQQMPQPGRPGPHDQRRTGLGRQGAQKLLVVHRSTLASMQRQVKPLSTPGRAPKASPAPMFDPRVKPANDVAACPLEREGQYRVNQGRETRDQQPEGKTGRETRVLDIGFVHTGRMVEKQPLNHGGTFA